MTTWNEATWYPIHNHFAYVDAQGRGVTDGAAGHDHQVVDGVVQPADDGHTHKVTTLSAGAGY